MPKPFIKSLKKTFQSKSAHKLQDSEDDRTSMASSSKQITDELEAKRSNISSLDPKTEALHAFRTITTMLSFIQSTRGTGNQQPKPHGPGKELLKLLDAFAAVLVRNNGVIAVTARPYDGSGEVEVLASYSNEESLPISQPRSPGHMLRNIFISQNPRDLTLKQRDVVDPATSVPGCFKGIVVPSQLFTTFLSHSWPTLTSQVNMDKKNSFELHTWMIAKLIEMSGTDDGKVALSHYVIAVCYEKMITRMTYRVSTSFRDALKNLPPKIELSKRSYPINASISNDENFIAFLCSKQEQLKLRTEINILTKHEGDLYNQETYTTFHLILSEILELFLKSLKELKDMHHNLRGKLPSSKQLDDITVKIDFIAVVGTLLRLLVKSRALQKCIYSIVRFLPDRAAGIKAKVDNKTNDDEDDEERDGDDEEDGLYRDDEDEELEGDLGSVGQGSVSIKKSHACLRSLNLAVVYVDAILVLSDFVRRENQKHVKVDIDIKILRVPCPGKDGSMLPWKTLLQHEAYFPGKPSPSAKEIVDFLELRARGTDNQKSSKKSQKKSNKSPASVSTEVSPESVSAKLAKLRGDDLNENDFTTKIDQAVNSLMTLQYGDTTSESALTKYINSIIHKLKSAKGLYSSKVDLNNEIDGIMEMLKTLADNTRLERMLRKGSPLDTGSGFGGTPHAEVLVAAHCTSTDPKWFPPTAIPAAGVSKFCCPICGFVLKNVERPFIFTNTHNTIRACSLPATLPLNVIEAAIAQFGYQLREELGELMKRTDVLHSCDESINSKDFSAESFGSNFEICAKV